jgi:hypothetical protein
LSAISPDVALPSRSSNCSRSQDDQSPQFAAVEDDRVLLDALDADPALSLILLSAEVAALTSM